MMIERAIIVAAKAFNGKKTKEGTPRMVDTLAPLPLLREEEELVLCVLRDILEVKTLEDVEREGFSERIIEALEAITRRPREAQTRYAKRIAANSLALQVKHGILLFEEARLSQKEMNSAEAKELEKKKQLLGLLGTA